VIERMFQDLVVPPAAVARGVGSAGGVQGGGDEAARGRSKRRCLGVTGARRDATRQQLASVAFFAPVGAGGRRQAGRFHALSWTRAARAHAGIRDPPPTLCHLLRPNQPARCSPVESLWALVASLSRPVPDVAPCSAPCLCPWPGTGTETPPRPAAVSIAGASGLCSQKTQRSDAAPTGRSMWAVEMCQDWTVVGDAHSSQLAKRTARQRTGSGQIPGATLNGARLHVSMSVLTIMAGQNARGSLAHSTRDWLGSRYVFEPSRAGISARSNNVARSS
jgi:hypothetical protein